MQFPVPSIFLEVALPLLLLLLLLPSFLPGRLLMLMRENRSTLLRWGLLLLLVLLLLAVGPPPAALYLELTSLVERVILRQPLPNMHACAVFCCLNPMNTSPGKCQTPAKPRQISIPFPLPSKHDRRILF